MERASYDDDKSHLSGRELPASSVIRHLLDAMSLIGAGTSTTTIAYLAATFQNLDADLSWKIDIEQIGR